MRSLNEMSSIVLKFLVPNKKIFYLVLIGLAIRLALAPYTSWTADTYAFYDAEMGIMAGIGPYGNAIYSYPPLFALIAYPFVQLAAFIVDPSSFIMFEASVVDIASMTGMLVPYVTSPAFNLALKMPIILADLATGLVIYHFVKERFDEDKARNVFILWFFNPLVIFISSVHGQFDVLPAFMTIIAMIAFLRERYFVSGLALGLGVLFKVYPLYLIIMYLVILTLPLLRSIVKGGFTRKALNPISSFIVGGGASLLTILPLLLTSSTFLGYIFRRGSYATYGGINMWFFIPSLEGVASSSSETSAVALILPTILLIGTMVLIISISLLIVRGHAHDVRMDAKTLIRCNVIVIGVVLLTNTVTNPQYLIWLIPFLILLALWEDRMMMKVAVITIFGLLFFFTLQSYYVFHYPLTTYTDLASISDINNHVRDYFEGGGVLRRSWALSITGFVGALAIFSAILPEKYDPLDKMRKAVKRRLGR